jgi:hypothetical protein
MGVTLVTLARRALRVFVTHAATAAASSSSAAAAAAAAGAAAPRARRAFVTLTTEMARARARPRARSRRTQRAAHGLSSAPRCAFVAFRLRGARRRSRRARATRQPRVVSPSDVFVTQEVDMRAIKWVGCAPSLPRAPPHAKRKPRSSYPPADARTNSMNYNHCLCVWRPEALAHVYDQAVAHLVSARHYPESILELKCVPKAITLALSIQSALSLTLLGLLLPPPPQI